MGVASSCRDAPRRWHPRWQAGWSLDATAVATGPLPMGERGRAMAILTFPLGLLFLLFKTERTLTVMIESEPGGSRVDLVGATRRPHARVARPGAGQRARC